MHHRMRISLVVFACGQKVSVTYKTWGHFLMTLLALLPSSLGEELPLSLLRELQVGKASTVGLPQNHDSRNFLFYYCAFNLQQLFRMSIQISYHSLYGTQALLCGLGALTVISRFQRIGECNLYPLMTQLNRPPMFNSFYLFL